MTFNPDARLSAIGRGTTEYQALCEALEHLIETLPIDSIEHDTFQVHTTWDSYAVHPSYVVSVSCRFGTSLPVDEWRHKRL